ncbi:beta-N-acetylhexosaminidase [Kordiimonas sp.]|uniref:beta-N-acetylhexosaminidase n=1 Tax=Kordiimonas sp. TaxID=1970157 RepID=UPI003A8DF781
MKMKLLVTVAVSLVLSGFLIACREEGTAQTIQAPAIIPAPAQLETREGSFELTANTSIAVPAGDKVLARTAAYLADKLRTTTGLTLTVIEGGDNRAGIRFARASGAMGTGAYNLAVDAKGGIVQASTDEGFFYGAMSLWQLADPQAHGTFMPFVEITDSPRLEWRGAMLDVSRHFRSVDFVKNFIDWMAVHKMNVFHWHLTDDQGWRIEIKKYPKLTSIGAWRVPAGDAPQADIDPATGEPRLYGGFYTQEQVKDVVAYAAERFITVMPEIDLPGHASAAVAAYPEFGTEPVEAVGSDWGIYYSTFNLEPATITFLEDVMDEVLALFPSTFVHIGGDEVATRQWENSARIKERMEELGIENVHEVQPYFTRHFANYLAERGRRLIGWDEILEGGSIADSAIMSWRGIKGGVEAAKAGRQVVMAPSPIYYTDYRQSYLPDEPPGRDHVQTLQDIYEFDPFEGLSDEEAKAVLGAQVTVFTEHMRTEERVEKMAFPRALALAERVWSPEGAKPFDDFARRLMPHMARLKAIGLHPADSTYAVRFDVSPATGGKHTVTLDTQSGQGIIRYTLDGGEPNAASPVYQAPLVLGDDAVVRAASFYQGTALSHVREQELDWSSRTFRNEDELALCSADLAIKLDDDWPRDGERANFLIDIVKPCWVYEAPDMAGVTGVRISVGNLPYNFQIGDLINKVELKEPQTEAGEIVVFKDSCDSGMELARLPLEVASKHYGVTTLEAPLEGAAEAQALCFQVAASHYEPLWALDWVQLERR